LRYHKERCSGKEVIIKSLAQQVASLKEEVESLRKDKVGQAPQTNQHIEQQSNGDHNQIAKQINNVVININNFGEETKEYITVEFARKCLEQGAYGIQHMLDVLYFNDEHPENNSVRMRSLKNSLVEVMKDTKWECRGLNDTIDTMINTSRSEILSKGIDTKTEPTMENLANIDSIQNIEPTKKKRIREKTKSKLVQRRDEGHTN
jgi:ferritin-like metal-binding protein YciE